MLILSLTWEAKRKDGRKYPAKGLVVAEQLNFIRLLENSSGTAIEVLCSEQPGTEGKTYWRIEKLLKGGSEPSKPAGETKQPPAETKPAAAETKVPYDPIGELRKTLCQCEHPAAVHTYGTDGCTSPDCPCKKFAVGPATASMTAKPASTPPAQPAAQPASPGAQPATSQAPPAIKPPIIKPVNREVGVGKGDKAKWVPVVWQNVTGTVASVSAVRQASNKTDFIELVIAGLPPRKGNEKVLHATFYVRHKSLFDAISTAKPGDSVVFDYEPDTVKTGANAGMLVQNVEDVIFVRGREYQEGKMVISAGAEETRTAPPVGETASPTGLFEEGKK